jgi:hypothetical protein
MAVISLLAWLGRPLSIDKQLNSKISVNKEKLSKIKRIQQTTLLIQGDFPYFKEHLLNGNLLNSAEFPL